MTMPAEPKENFTQDLRPIPDPTVLTTQQLNQAVEIIREQIGANKELTFTRMDGIRDLLLEKISGMNLRSEQATRDSKQAITAAFDAAKEAVGKSENSTTKQIDAMNDKIEDQKQRLNLIEGRSQGIGQGWGYVIGVIGLIAAVAAIVTALAAVKR